MLSVDNLRVTFSGSDLFSDISFLINPRERIGLVGKNGAGKSTILKIICGLQTPSSGTVSRSGDCTIGYLPQQMVVHDDCSLFEECGKAFEEILNLEKTIADATEQVTLRTDYESDEYQKLLETLSDATERYHLLGGDNRDAELEKVLLGLGFKRDEFDKPTSKFSGGWRMRIELAKLLLRQPSLFLLDEPTNHLDIESIQWLEEYLQNFSGAVILISHDRAFLDNVTNRTIEIMNGRAWDYKTNYSHYVTLRAERLVQQTAAFENQQKLIEKTEEFIEKFRYKATKSNQVQSRIKQLEKIDRIEIEKEDVSTMNIRFPAAPRSGQVVLEAKESGQSFGEKHVFSGVDITVQRGEKIALVGKNGEGKTTFVRQIMGELIPTQGEVRTGHNIRIGYLSQNHEDLMNGDFTVFDTLDRVAVGDIRTKLRDILGAFLFRGEDIDKRVKVLSGGERSRLAMARLMLEPYNLLILDEPTNHMDMRSKEVLKQALAKYDGTLVVISHDRDFLDGLIETVYEFRDGAVKQYLGGIWEFVEKRKLENMAQIGLKSPEKNAKTSEQTLEKKAEKKAERKPNNTPDDKAAARQKKQIKLLEEQIEVQEAKVSELEESLADPSKYSPELLAQYTAAKADLDKTMSQWEELIG